MTNIGQPSAQTGKQSAEPSAGEPAAPPARLPASSYRLQLGPAFGLDSAAAALPYLAQLGITDVYTSPYFTASANSASGYDVCDHESIQPELGGCDAFDRFARALRETRLGHLIDIVPNHMGIDETRNRWWRDVLARGPRSMYAGMFDIDWRPVKPELRDKLLLPILDKPYGDALEAGDVRLARDGDALVVRCGPRTLPVDPSTPAIANPDALTADDVHAVLERQAYRLAYWRTASDEINYRRFFDVDNLIGLRMEREDVFDAAHRLVARLLERGIVTGIRVDHPDGLTRPAEYFRRLQSLAARATGHRPYVVVEKILVEDEHVRADWAVDGTTGYEFLAAANGLFIEPRGVLALGRLHRQLTRTARPFDLEAYESKRLIMATTLASEVEMLASALNRLSERSRRSRDFTLNSLRRALAEFIACLPVYRTYVTPDSADAADATVIRGAAARARRRNPHLEPSVFQFIVSVILGGGAAAAEGDRDSDALAYPPMDDADAAERARFAERLQQFTGSVFAKGVEDTALFRHIPLLSASEVGGTPGHPCRDAAAFHRENQWRVAHSSVGLLATATHDTKLGEDTRARLNAISEMPAAWSHQVRRWRALARRWRQPRGHEWMPAPNDEYRLYQVLVGTWPFGADENARVDDAYVARVQAYMQKAAREAKQQTSWINPDAEYESALERFVACALEGGTGERVRAAGVDFARRIARLGVVNSLSQLVLKLGSPGVADIYQGCETWDLTLVDPDNRRPIDFAARVEALDAIEPMLTRVACGDATVPADVRALLDAWTSGRIKMLITAAGLRARRRQPELFLAGRYQGVDAGGDDPALVAFVREHESHGALIVAPARVKRLMQDDRAWPLGPEAWAGVQLRLPPAWSNAKIVSVLTGERCEVSSGGQVDAARLLVTLPVGLWLRES